MEKSLSREQRARLESGKVTSTEVRAMAKEFKKNHSLAMKLWETPVIGYRLLSILIMDKSQITGLLDKLILDIEKMGPDAMHKLGDWLMANQIVNLKDKDLIVGKWMDESSILKQGLFWSYQARVIRTAKSVTMEQKKMLGVIESKIKESDPLIQWSMNYCAAQIGIFNEELRDRCISLGEKAGLYKDYKVSKGCTSPYLPIWINSEVEKNKSR